MATVSNYKYPEDHVRWIIQGDNLGIVTDGVPNQTIDSTKPHRKATDMKPIDESVDNGILIHYNAEPNTVTATDTSGDLGNIYPDVDNYFHKPLVDYIKMCLFMDKASIAVDPNMSQMAIGLSTTYERRWRDATEKWLMRQRTKIGGSRAIVPTSLI
tara:strand:+ start:321 stop:791 length:471 start_codon:yes stop_codon:yes gene_type:complete